MARGEYSVESLEGEGPPSISFEDIPLRVDSIGVITWLKPVREPRANAFWKNFYFPLNV